METNWKHTNFACASFGRPGQVNDYYYQYHHNNASGPYGPIYNHNNASGPYGPIRIRDNEVTSTHKDSFKMIFFVPVLFTKVKSGLS